jgi:enoyl-CoA hydratase
MSFLLVSKPRPHVTLNRPERMNAMSFDVMIPFREALEEISIAARISSLSRVGVELAKRLLWSSLDVGSLEAHMLHEGVAQLYVRNLTGNFEEMIRARRDGRTPVYLDDVRQKDA